MVAVTQKLPPLQEILFNSDALASEKSGFLARVSGVGRFLRDKKTDIAFIGANVAIGVAAKVLAATVLTASGGLAVAVGGAALAGLGRVVVDHVKERRAVTILPEGQRDWVHEARLLRQKIFSWDASKKIGIGVAISAVTFGTLDVLHHTDAGQQAAQWAGQKLSSAFQAVANINVPKIEIPKIAVPKIEMPKIRMPGFLKGIFAEPEGPSVSGVVHYSAVSVDNTLLSDEQFVKPDAPAPLPASAPVTVDKPDVIEKVVRHAISHHTDILPDIAPVDDAPLPPLMEDTDVSANNDYRDVARICDVDFGRADGVRVDCTTYKADMDAGDAVVLNNVDEPDPKKGLKVLFASAKEKTAQFFERTISGSSGAISEMAPKEVVETGLPPAEITSIAEPDLAEQVEAALATPDPEPQLTPQQMAQRVMMGGSFNYS